MKLFYLFVILAAVALVVDGKKKRKNKKKHSSTSSESLGDSSDTDESLSLSRESGSEESRTKYLDLKGRIRGGLAATALQPGQSSVVCSPFSALKPIGMLLYGSEGGTEKEMLQAIGVDRRSSVHTHFKKLLASLGDLSGLHMATRIYIDKHHNLHHTFKHEATHTFGSCIEQIDMRDTSNVAREIDSWIQYHTNNRITRIIDPEDIQGAHIVIVDAIYFWGKWKYPFERLHHGTFHGYSGGRTVTMMSVTKKFKYGKSHELNSQVIEIPYKDRDTKLMIVMPNSHQHKLSSILNDLKSSPNIINKVKWSKKLVQLTIPKFSIENTLDIGQLYQKVGLHKMFSSRSGLVRVSDKRLVVDKSFQKVAIVIDDEGTEAAGGLGIALSPFPVEDSSMVTFNVDRPFLFFIIGKKQQLFAGVLT